VGEKGGEKAMERAREKAMERAREKAREKAGKKVKEVEKKRTREKVAEGLVRVSFLRHREGDRVHYGLYQVLPDGVGVPYTGKELIEQGDLFIRGSVCCQEFLEVDLNGFDLGLGRRPPRARPQVEPRPPPGRCRAGRRQVLAGLWIPIRNCLYQKFIYVSKTIERLTPSYSI
jgi:hypothetical protein